jgi:uncharacterized protein YcfL
LRENRRQTVNTALLLLVVCACLLFGLGFAANQKPTPVPEVRAMHHVSTANGIDDRICSSVAVGPHTLLTAMHCIVNPQQMEVDGQMHKITALDMDKQDHVLVHLDTFFYDVLPVEQREPGTDEHVRVWGWPGSSRYPIFREGWYMGLDPADKDVRVWQLPVYHGDSGAPLVSDDGKVITLVSEGWEDVPVGGTYSLNFTPEQMLRAAQ